MVDGNAMYQKISHEAWKDIPSSYIFTSEDMTIPPNYQKFMVESLQKKGRPMSHTVELHTAHCPNLTATTDVVKFVQAVIESQE
jgi:hypothetical protein